jgi:hypothetical protein
MALLPTSSFKNSVNFGFWRGVDIQDAHGMLGGSGEKMRHVKLVNSDDINEDAFKDTLFQAVKLNLTKGDPTKS